MILGQAIPDATAVVDKATGVSWEAGMLAVLIIAFMSVIIYQIKRQNDHADKEREATGKREEGYKDRMNILEGQIHNIQTTNSEHLVELIKEMTAAKVASTAVQAATRETLEKMTTTLGQVNGDIKEMCQLLKHNPCLLAGAARGHLKVLDASGQELTIKQEGETG